MTWGVEAGGRILRVPVKSTMYRRRGMHSYSLNVMGPGRKLCEEGVVDFFAIYLIPIDTWYIIPSDWEDADQFALHAGGRRKTYERYREAWELLRTVSGRLYVGVSIESGDVSSNSIRFQQQSCDPCAPDIP